MVINSTSHPLYVLWTVCTYDGINSGGVDINHFVPLIDRPVAAEFVMLTDWRFFVKGHAPSVVLYTQDQISDLIVRFCGGTASLESLCSVLSVDRTFNVSTLFSTVTVFKNKAVI